MDSWRVSGAFRCGHDGFGLIEQIVTLLVLAVLATVAVPGLRRLHTGHELRVAQSDYMAALQHARNLAINDQARIIVCPSRDGLACNNDNAWQEGWLIGRDPDGKGQSQGRPIYTGGKYSDAIRIVGSEKKYFGFKSDGTASNTIQRLVFCTREKQPRVLVVRVAMQGRIRAAPAEPEDISLCTASG